MFHKVKFNGAMEPRIRYARLVVTASFAFCVINFEPIEFQTHSAPQNDRLNLSFMNLCRWQKIG